MGARDELSSRVAALRESRGYSNYGRVRDEVLQMLDMSSDAVEGAPSAYWTHELGNFEYMLDASPLIVESLRHHTFHVTGIRSYEYRPHRDEGRRRFEAKCGCSSSWRATSCWYRSRRSWAASATRSRRSLQPRHAEVLRGADRPRARGRAGRDPRAGPQARLGDRRRLGGLRLPVQDALPRRHVRDRRPARAVPVLRHVSDDAFPGGEGVRF